MMHDAKKDITEYITRYSKALSEMNHPVLQKATDFLRTRDYGTIFTAGNGGSMSTAEHMAADLNKWTNSGDQKKYIRAQCLNSNPPEMSALTNDVGWSKVYETLLDIYQAKKDDVLIVYSVHGGKGKEKAGQWSENLTGAIDWMNRKDGTTIGITGGDGGAFKDLCDYCIIVPSASTPIVEGLHSVISHIIADSVRAHN
ncbi:SIS domain-containing protein [Candidatus Pacearchaeota archaeon]|nr:SIS domain-containing protein [Candidatus Pacearchaeota archaeon]